MELAHDEYQELLILLHLTRNGAPFQGYQGVKIQVKVARTEFVLALERWRTLVKLEVRHGGAETEVVRTLSWDLRGGVIP
jgi:hypothetical protein